MDQSIIFIQICPKSPLYTAPFKYPKRIFGSEIGHFLSLPKLNQNFNFKRSIFKINKMCKVKIRILEILNRCFCFLNPQSWLKQITRYVCNPPTLSLHLMLIYERLTQRGTGLFAILQH